MSAGTFLRSKRSRNSSSVISDASQRSTVSGIVLRSRSTKPECATPCFVQSSTERLEYSFFLARWIRLSKRSAGSSSSSSSSCLELLPWSLPGPKDSVAVSSDAIARAVLGKGDTDGDTRRFVG